MRAINEDDVIKMLSDGWRSGKYPSASTVKSLPTIEPERKKGKWLPDNNNYITPHFVCSACGMPQKVETIMYKPIWAFCPRCGARMMEGEQE